MGTAISKDGKELYVSTGRGNAVAIIDTQKNEVPRSPLPSARGEGEGLPRRSVTKAGEESIVAMIPVGNRAWGIALDPSGRWTMGDRDCFQIMTAWARAHCRKRSGEW